MSRRNFVGFVAVVALAAATGCSANGASPRGGTGGAGGSAGTAGAGATGGTAGSAGTAGAGTGGFGATGPGGTGGSGGNQAVGEVYGHSATTLYKLEPFSKTVTIVGNFDCLGGAVALGGGMWDIALDKNGQMFGTVGGGFTGSLVAIDKATAHCAVKIQGTFPNSLTYLPAGTLLPNDEALVGFNQATYVRIDTNTGNVTTIGSLNPNPTGQSWESSGDVVSIIGDKTYLTVKPAGQGAGSIDSIVEVDPKTGQAVKLIGSTGFSDLWGLGYWAGVAYGFSSTGQLAQIDLTTGAGTAIPLTNVPAGLSFWGAGVTTAAPTQPPK